MAKFKKLVMLCTALMMTASIAGFASCGGEKKDNSSPDTSASTPADNSSEDASSEDASSDDTSSPDDGGSEEPAAYYEEIIAEGKGTVEGSAETENFGTLKLNIPEAGTYGIFTAEDVVMFGAEGATDGWSDFMDNYTFEVAEAGEITLATYAPWEIGEVSYTYYLYKMNTLVIEDMTGEAKLASNLRTPVTFVAPAAGEYILTCNQQLKWFSGLGKDEEIATSSSYLITAEEAGEIDFYVMLDNFDAIELDFVWEIITVSDLALKAGDNNVDLYAGVFRAVTFTATEAGAYSLTVANDTYNFQAGIYGYNAEWDFMGWLKGGSEATYNFSIAAGETKTLHILYDGYDVNYEAGPAKIEANVVISALETADPSALTVGDNVIAATEEGVKATFTAAVAGTYSISDDYTYAMYFADTVDEGFGGDSYKEITLAAGESITFTVKYDDLITITIEKLPESILLNAGENTVSVPAEGAILNFAGLEEDATYTLTFDGSLVNIIMDQGMQSEIFSETEFTYSPWNSYLINSKTEEAIESLTITVTFIRGGEGGGDIGGGDEEEIIPDDAYVLTLGENAVAVPQEFASLGMPCVFTASQAGTYTIATADGEQNAWIWKKDYSVYVQESSSATFTLEAGEAILLYFATWSEVADTIEVIISLDGASTPAEPVEDKVIISLDATNDLTIGVGCYLTNSNTLTLKGEYTFDWNVFVSNEETENVNDTVAVDDSFITVLVNDVEITSGTKLTYAEDTVVTIVIKSSDNTQNVNVSFTVTKTPEQVKPDNEWTNNY